MNAGPTSEAPNRQRTAGPWLLAFFNEASSTAARHVRFGLWVGGITGSVLGVALALLGAVVRGACPNAAILAVFGVVLLALAGVLHGALAGALAGIVSATLVTAGTVLHSGSARERRARSGSRNPALSREAQQP